LKIPTIITQNSNFENKFAKFTIKFAEIREFDSSCIILSHFDDNLFRKKEAIPPD